MFCKNCGRVLKESDNFCPSCGMKKERIVTTNTKNTKSIVSIVLGMISIFIPLLGLPLSIVGLVFGIKAKKEEKNSVGMILSIIGLVLSILVISFFVLVVILAYNEEKRYGDRNYSDYSEDFDDFFNHFDESFDESFNEDIEDSIEGYKWKSIDGSILYLYDDGKYIWYQSDNDHKDNYTEGTYKIKTKEDAVNYIAKDLSEYNLSKEEQYKFFNDSKNNLYKIDNYVYIGLNCIKNINDGKESEHALGLVSYYGFYDKMTRSLETSNLKTSVHGGFVRYGKIS